MRLIDADELKRLILSERDKIPLTLPPERYGFGVPRHNRHGDSMRGGIRKALRCMEQCPTVDAVIVVQCRDCKWYTDDHCTNVNGAYKTLIFNPYWYCASGERKNNETD